MCTAKNIEKDFIVASRYIKTIKTCKDKNREFSITLPQYRKLLQKKRCYYTGIPISIFTADNVSILTLDRIDNSKGYTIDNVVACSQEFNSLKSVWECPENNLNQNNLRKALFILNEINPQ